MNQDAPYSGIAGLMAAKGRYGDTELLHVRPDELAGLASVGQLTINPDTGLPEAFSFKSLLPAVGAIAGSVLFPAGGIAGTGLLSSSLGAGFGGFAGGLAAGQSPTEALIGGLVSGATTGILGNFMGPEAGELAKIQKEAAKEGLTQGAAQKIVTDLGVQSIPAVQGALEATKQAPLGAMDIAGSLLQKGSTYIPLASPIAEAVMTPPEFDTSQDEGLAALESTYTPRDLRITGGEFTQGDLSQEDYTTLALEGGLQSPLTPFRYEEEDTVTLAEGGTPEAKEVDTQVEEDTVASEEKRKEEEILQKRKAASEVDKFISNTVGGAALGALIQGGLNQNPAATATPYGQGAQPINTGGNFGFNQGGLVGLSNGGSTSTGSKKNSIDREYFEEVVRPLEFGDAYFKSPKYYNKDTDSYVGYFDTKNKLTFGAGVLADNVLKKLMGKKNFKEGDEISRSIIDNEALKRWNSSVRQAKELYPNLTNKQVNPIAEMVYQMGKAGVNQFKDMRKAIEAGDGDAAKKAALASEWSKQTPKRAREVSERLRIQLGSKPKPTTIKTPTIAGGGQIQPYFEGKVIGPGDGQSDQVLFDVEGNDPDMALLSPDEYVIPADAVAMIGSGSSNAGAKKLDGFVKNIRKKATGKTKQQKPIKQGLESFLA